MIRQIKATRSDASKAEHAAEHFAVEVFGCIETRRMIRTRFFKIDFFGADVVGKKSDGSHCYIQVTSGQNQAVTVRRRKLESHVWHKTDGVYLLQMTKEQVGRRINYCFRVFEYHLNDNGKRSWSEKSTKSYWIQSIGRRWFKAMQVGNNIINELANGGKNKHATTA